MPNNANRRLPAHVLQADLDCITALKAIEGYDPSNPADSLAAITDLQTRVSAAGERDVGLPARVVPPRRGLAGVPARVLHGAGARHRRQVA